MNKNALEHCNITKVGLSIYIVARLGQLAGEFPPLQSFFGRTNISRSSSFHLCSLEQIPAGL